MTRTFCGSKATPIEEKCTVDSDFGNFSGVKSWVDNCFCTADPSPLRVDEK